MATVFERPKPDVPTSSAHDQVRDSCHLKIYPLNNDQAIGI